MKYMSLLLLLVCGFSMVACSHLNRKYENRYKSSRIEKPMMVPAGLSSSSIEGYYHIPAARSDHAAGKVSLLPPDTLKK